MQRGVIGAGNFIVDTVYTMDAYPEEQTLADIRDAYSGGGGGAFNVLCDLAVLGADFPLEAIGCVGADDKGRWIVEELNRLDIDVQGLRTVDDRPTSTTLVMAAKETGRRTFFHQRGA